MLQPATQYHFDRIWSALLEQTFELFYQARKWFLVDLFVYAEQNKNITHIELFYILMTIVFT